MMILLYLIPVWLGLMQSTTSLEIQLFDCRTEDERFYSDIVLIAEDGEKRNYLITRNDNLIKNLDRGRYELEFTSIFGRKEKEIIELSKKKQIVKLCLDKFTSEIEPIEESTFLKSLASGEQIQFTFGTEGCFHAEMDSLIISREKDDFLLKWGDVFRQLDQASLQILQDFENKLFNAKFGTGCTTIETYGILYKEAYVFSTIDASCKWYGFSYLRQRLK